MERPVQNCPLQMHGWLHGEKIWLLISSFAAWKMLSSLNRTMLFLPLLYSVYRLCLIVQWIGYVWEHACGYLCPNWNLFICLGRSGWINPFWMITLIYLSVCAHNEAMSLLRLKCVRASGGLEIWEYAHFLWFSISTYIKDIAYL